jgi:hypothetical protein
MIRTNWPSRGAAIRIRAASAAILLGAAAHAGDVPRLQVIAADFEDGLLMDYSFVNSVVGWDVFFEYGFRGGSTVIGNLEAGHAWFGHEVFERPPGAPAAFSTWNNPATGALNELDYHATTVAHVLAGSGYIPDNGGAYTLTGLGMAPEARLVSGAIATGFSPVTFGAFEVSEVSLTTAYRDFFRGVGLGEGIARLDVINSSWGGGGDPAANSPESLAIDGLAFTNPDVALVVSAGNGGPSAVTGSPANGFNSIAVGSLGGPDFLDPSPFTSSGFADFFNPVENGGTLHSGVRVAVDIAAPGEMLFLAAYLGDSGSIGAHGDFASFIQEPSPADLYFIELAGTSYSAPIVAGGVALLKDVARAGLGETPETHPESFDTRVIKSALMAGARPTNGWDNGQDAFNVTTQALDPSTGAGMLDLVGAADVYLGATRGLSGGAGGLVAASGWDMTTVDLMQMVDYVFAAPFDVATTLAVALNWFAVRGFDDDDNGLDLAFSNLDLQVWQLDGEGAFVTMVGESRTLYNNTEFLRFDALDPGRYGMRVVFDGMVYDTTGGIGEETFALAWRAVAIPEPGAGMLALMAIAFLVTRRVRKV